MQCYIFSILVFYTLLLGCGFVSKQAAINNVELYEALVGIAGTVWTCQMADDESHSIASGRSSKTTRLLSAI